jgi:hypothetical protein
MPVGGPNAPYPKGDLDVMPYQYNFPISARQVRPHELVIDSSRRDERFSVECEDLRHAVSWTFSGVVWVDPRSDKTELVVEVTAANLHGTFTEKVAVHRNVAIKQVTELVNISSGKAIVQPLISPQILQAMKSRNFSDFEFGFENKGD